MVGGNEGSREHGISRRELIKRAGVGVGGLALSGAAAQTAWARPRVHDAGNTIKIGYVSPLTGPASGFGEPDPYVLGLARKHFAKGLKIGGKDYTVQVINKDGQSSPSVGAQVANDLIHSDGVDLMLTTSTPETVNPVADACEAAGVPCISSVEPWESWYFGRGAKDPAKSPFRYTFHFSFGTHEFASGYLHSWQQLKTNKRLGVLYPNDADGNAFRNNLAPLLEKGGYKIVDPGAYQDGTNDYSAQIAVFKKNNCQVFNTAPIPPDFATFWRQAAQQGYTSKVIIAQIAKTGLFPSQVLALGSLGNNLASAVYWGKTWPYKSSFTGISSHDLAFGYQKATGREWNQQLGPSLALFDVAVAAMKKSGNPKDKNAVAKAMFTLEVDTLLGHLAWGKSKAVPANVVPTPIPAGQWRKVKGKYKIDFFIDEHSVDPRIPIAGKLRPYHSK